MVRLVLESFDTELRAAMRGTDAGPALSEEARLAAFEAGYKAGWDDAAAAEADDQTRIRADLARNLQALSFTYHEARGAVLKSLAPLLQEIVARVLPALARDTLAETVAERLRPLADAAAEAPIEIRCSPANRDTLAAVIDGRSDLPVRLSPEPTLGDGQVYLTFATHEEEIDLDGAIAAIAAAVSAFFETDHREGARAHG